MEQLHIAELDTEHARLLADHASVFQDLGFCIQCCDRLASILTDGPKDSVAQQALWTSALIAYARCFATGVRYGLTPEIYARFEGEPLEVHKRYVEMRNKHIAHSVNPFDQVKVGALLSPPAAEKREVLGVSTLSMKHIRDSLEGVEQLRLMARTALGEVAR